MSKKSEKLKSLANLALMTVNPDFFGLDLKEQIAYRVSLPKTDYIKIKSFLIEKILGVIIIDEDELRNFSQRMPDAESALINEALLYIEGVGDNYFFFNEHLPKPITEYPTLYDYDLQDHDFQENAKSEEIEGYAPRPYTGSLYLSWARAMLDGQFTYLTLSMASGYIFSEVQSYGEGVVSELIPHEYVQGKDNGKPEGKGFVLDFQIQAAGMEEHLEELKDRFYRVYLNDLWERQANEWTRQENSCAYIIDDSQEGENNRHIVFSDPDALKQIRFLSFVSDCRNIEQDPAPLFDVLKAEKEKCKKWLTEQLQDIKDNYDPRVKKLRPKRKIIVSPQARDLL